MALNHPISSEPRVVLITGSDLEHRYVANALGSAFPLAAIVVDHGRRLTIGGRVHQLWRRYSVPQLASRATLALLRRVWRDRAIRNNVLLETLGPSNCSKFAQPELIHNVEGINTSEGVGAIANLRPDVLLIYGTGIVGSKVLSQARHIALNMHTGISPYYRGSDCAFWPVHNCELHMLGATVHECTSMVDGGQIFATSRASLQADDCLFAVFARCVQAGADLYVRTVEKLLTADLAGTRQDFSIGREYRAFMRGVRAEWKTRQNVRRGLIRHYVEGHQRETLQPGSSLERHEYQ